MRVLALLLLLLLAAPLRGAPEEVSVRIIGEQLSVELPVRGGGGEMCGKALLVDSSNVIRWTGESRANFSGEGKLTVPIEVGLSGFSSDQWSEFVWFRLRYGAGTCGSSPELETVSMSEVLRETFEIRAHASEGSLDKTVRVWVQAVDPRAEPLPGIEVEAELENVTIKGVTGSDGSTILEIPVAEGTIVETELKVRAHRGPIKRELTMWIYAGWSPRVLLSTDKGIYQPGQFLRVRAVLLGPSSRALGGKNAVITVYAPDRTTAFRQVVTTSRFGIAEASWPIPADASTGTYQVRAGSEALPDRESWGWAEVEVARYELPLFTVAVKQRKPYVLAGERAEVVVSASYLSGQPLRDFSARIVRSSRWRHDSSTSESDKVAEGQAAQGSFSATFEVPAFEKSRWRSFEDTRFEAHVTDPTSGRTERLRFDVRSTADPIHVRLLGSPARYENLDSTLYVSTFYADGSPASCDVELSFEGKVPGRLKTNRLGIGRFVARVPLAKTVELFATDSKGLRGTDESDPWRWRSAEDSPPVRASVAKTIFRRGESIDVELEAESDTGTAFVDVSRDAVLLSTSVVPIKGRRGHLTIPFSPAFEGAVTVAAHEAATRADSLSYHNVSHRTVLFPSDRKLLLNGELSRKSYRPGEAAHAHFTLRGRDGTPVEGALGIAVVDSAVEVRAWDREWFDGGPDPFTAPFRSPLDDDLEISGFHISDLAALDLSRPVSPEMDLAAEVLLNHWPSYVPRAASSRLNPSFATLFESGLKELRGALLAEEGRLPQNEAELFEALRSANVAAPRDPWEVPYEFVFEQDGFIDVVSVRSLGPDKARGTRDDSTAATLRRSSLFREERGLQRALADFCSITGLYPNSVDSIRLLLLAEGLDPDSWRDRDGKPVQLRIRSTESDVIAEMVSDSAQVVGRASSNFARRIVASIHQALEARLRRTGCLPDAPLEFQKALAEAGLDPLVTDPFGVAWYPRIKLAHGLTDLFTFSEGDRRYLKRRVQNRATIEVLSVGPDAIEGTSDDSWIDSITLVQPVSEAVVEVFRPSPEPATPVLPPAPDPPEPISAAIHGKVTEGDSASLPGVRITCTNSESGLSWTTVSDAQGRYAFSTLPAGVYSLDFQLSGFMKLTKTNIQVNRSGPGTRVDALLRLSSVFSEVTVAAESPALSTSQSSVGTSPGKKGPPRGLPSPRFILQTPRLREFFPETLVWEPLLQTGKSGRAQLGFKLADNITTWSLLAVASSEDGRTGFFRKDFAAFLPFYVEHEPPPVLTAGDEISLPVIVRNYQARRQAALVEIIPAPWFRLLGPPSREVTVPSNGSNTVNFRFRAEQVTEDGRQRVAARGTGDPGRKQPADSVEKPVHVRANAEERSVSRGVVLRGTSRVLLDIPPEALPGSIRGKVTIYPDTVFQLSESIEALLQLPHGCAEQTISAAYPSLLMLRLLNQPGATRPDLRKRAETYLRTGVDRLRSYQNSDGGVSFFGDQNPSLGLTAYSVTFLLDAAEFVPVDERRLESAIRWLMKEQRSDGSWSASTGSGREMVEEAMVARALAKASTQVPGATLGARRALAYLESMGKALAGLDRGTESYFLSAFSLAAIEMGVPERSDSALERLRTLAEPVQQGIRWPDGLGSPFNSWGRASGLEATALATQALLLRGKDHELADRALLFLLRERDSNGIWHTGQASTRVLEALVLGLKDDSTSSGPRSVAFEINGKPAGRFEVPQPNTSSAPLSIDLAGFLRSGENVLGFASDDRATAIGRVSISFAIPWKAPVPSPDLALDVAYAPTETRVGDEVTVNVEAHRKTAGGGGMLLLEAGLPPGAEVDRARLTDLVRDGQQGIHAYELQPDRVIFYLWPRWGADIAGERFSFRFRPRYGIRAVTAPSSLTDFYNPDVRVVLPPERFTVR